MALDFGVGATSSIRSTSSGGSTRGNFFGSVDGGCNRVVSDLSTVTQKKTEVAPVSWTPDHLGLWSSR